jgi:hypothetical protein
MFPIYRDAWPRVQPSRRSREIRGAIEFQIEGMREDGLPVPQTSSSVEYIEVAA